MKPLLHLLLLALMAQAAHALPAGLPDGSKDWIAPNVETAPTTTNTSKEPVTLNLRQSYRFALDNSSRLAELRARKGELRARVDEAFSAAYPTVDFTGGYTNVQPPVNFGNIPIQPSDNYNLGLTVRQALFTFGRLKWSTRAAELAEKSSQEEYRREVETLFADVATAYLDALLAERAVGIARVRVQAQETQLRDAQNLFKAGTAARFDVMRSESELSRVRQVELEAQNAARLTKDRLLTLLGLAPGTPLELAPTDNVEPPPTDVEGHTEQALRLRPELGVIGWALEAARARVELADTEDNPRVDLQTQATQRNVSGFAPGSQLSTGIVLSVPVFNGGLTEARVEGARRVVEQIEAQLETSRRTVRLDVRDAFNLLQNLWEKRQVAESNVAQAAESARVAEIRYRNGVSTNVELLSAQAAYGDALLAQAQTERDYQAAWARWRRAISAEYPEYVPGPILRPRAEETQP